ncbi:MAG TPA: branched-chain amino acid ABC transporter permease [Gaiellaceae bacterium]|jgi:branched-chain amino acid transport system permease protein|nr:branched-chain amino acid ABC transporter permease [Gaiellaceae bacterium]
MTLLLQNAIDAISVGSLYALFALGIALIFGIMRLINFAHGELIMVGSFALYLGRNLPWPVLIAIAIAACVVIALLMERIAFRPARGADATTLLITSFAVSFFLQNLAIMIFGSLPRTANISTRLSESFSAGALTIPWLDIVTIGVTAFLVVALGAFLGRTSVGLQMRAAAEDFRMARALGVRANVVIATAFAISGVLAGTASALLMIQTGTVTPTIGSSPVLIAFIATVLGGMGSLRGAVLGGLLLGVLTVALQSYLPLELRYYRDAFAYGAVILMLIARPQGLVVARTLVTRV